MSTYQQSNSTTESAARATDINLGRAVGSVFAAIQTVADEAKGIASEMQTGARGAVRKVTKKVRSATADLKGAISKAQRNASEAKKSVEVESIATRKKARGIGRAIAHEAKGALTAAQERVAKVRRTARTTASRARSAVTDSKRAIARRPPQKIVAEAKKVLSRKARTAKHVANTAMRKASRRARR